MPGVYVKGMEMPVQCVSCPLWRVLCPLNKPTVDYCGAAQRKIEQPYGGRPECCPLVEVPAHGRLIDADALRQSIRESIEECNKWADEVEGNEMYARVSQSLGTFVECSLRIKGAPTIIPAEEDNDG